MSTDQFEIESGGQPPRKKGMSTGMKVLIILGIVFLVLVLLCCGGIICSAWWASGMVSEDPVRIKEVTQGITDIDVPDGFEPKTCLDLKFPIFGRIMIFSVYEQTEGNGGLVLMGVGEALAQQNQEQIQQQLNQSLQQQGVEQENLAIESSSVKEVEIRGEPAQFVIAKGSGTASGEQRIQVTGTFKGKSGPAMLILNVDADSMDEQKIDEMIESIK